VSLGEDTSGATAARIRALYEARARAELAAADRQCPGADTVLWRGALLAEIAVVKGMPGPAEAAGEAALSGRDGAAIATATEALGWRPEAAFFTLSRPTTGLDPARCATRLRAQMEAVDPVVVVALDHMAAEDLARAFGAEPLEPGVATEAFGRRLVALTAFEETLSDRDRKQTAWAELQAARPPGPVY